MNEEEAVEYFFYDLKDRVLLHIQESMERENRQTWSVISANKLKKVWLDRVRFGFIRYEKPLYDMRRKMIFNTCKLWVNTVLSGHSPHCPVELFEIDEKWVEKTWDYITELSDYGTKPLVELAIALLQQDSAEEILVTIDKMLNVVHQTSDLCAIFVQGGSATLTELSA